MGVEWAELQPEIVELISKSLTIYADYLRFRCVCHSWRSSLPKTPLHLPPQLPWLMLSSRAFFDLSNNKTHLLNLPLSSHRTRICGSSHGWLVILDETPEVRLLNPITRATIALPPLYTFPNVTSFNYSNIGREYLIRNPYGGVDAFNLRQMCNSFLRKVVLSSSPSQSDDDFTAFAIAGHNNLAFCRKGYDSWVFVIEELYSWEDAVHHNGLFFAVSKGGIIAVCDVDGSFPPHVSIIQTTAPMQFSGDIHYIVFSGEDMLLVTRILEHDFSDEGDESNLVYRTVGFEIFKMNWSLLKWQKIETLGDRMLFIGGNSSLSFSASDFVGCFADCIYYTDDYSESNHDDAYGKHDLGIFRLWDQSIEPLPCYPRNSYSRLGWPLPIWVSPNPC
ncbi:F-box protein SKIP23-like [Gastrolobium bilobum]|uniref:F-box protein SKIP23-like n=1 Tax=Gastrolobium bilobum TaxID=150636 RepID=UPI002AAF88E8|nr:F-box protein SKIP23-like [Gastrolobium bilobum]